MNFEVIVLGTGGMGSAACYQLAKRGVKVAGIDQFSRIHANGSSHGQSRIIRKAYFEHPDYVPLLKRAYELWSELEKDSGKKLYHETGIIYSCPPNSELLRGLKKASEMYKIPLEQLSQRDIAKWFHPRKTEQGQDYEVVREPEAGYLEVESCVQAAMELAEKYGATFYENEKVLSWKAELSGVSVQTTERTFHAKHLVISTGAWTAEILNDLDLSLKVLKKCMYWFSEVDAVSSIKHQSSVSIDLLESRGMPCFLNETPTGIFYGFPMKNKAEGLKVAEHSGGDELKSPGEQNANLESEFDRVKNYIEENMPTLSTNLISHQPCMYTMTPDEHFIIDRHPLHSNVTFAAGFSGHGFKFASVVGEILADLSTTGSTDQPTEFLKLNEGKRFKK